MAVTDEQVASGKQIRGVTAFNLWQVDKKERKKKSVVAYVCLRGIHVANTTKIVNKY